MNLSFCFNVGAWIIPRLNTRSIDSTVRPFGAYGFIVDFLLACWFCDCFKHMRLLFPNWWARPILEILDKARDPENETQKDASRWAW